MQPVDGVIQHYVWGDHDAIPRLVGRPPDGRPWAELWLGTHPNGPATLTGDGPLRDVTGTLPYLLKVLAAAHPLSLQAHPDAARAAAGHAAGRYPDPFPKPELLVALGEFHAFCGVRPVDATLALLDDLGTDQLAAALVAHGLGDVLAALYRGRLPIVPILAACAGSERPEARWVTDLARRFPGDPSVAVTLLLNLVVLQRGQAIVLGPGNLHAYLGGWGIELMGASDNVVRGGLTAKPVDVDDLLEVVDLTPLAEPVLSARDVYELPGTTIRLHRLEGPATHVAGGHELVVTSAGATGYLAPSTALTVPDGITAYVAAA